MKATWRAQLFRRCWPRPLSFNPLHAVQVNTGPPRAALSFAPWARLTAAGPEPPCLVGRPPPVPACLDGPRCPPRRSASLCLGVDRARVPGARAGPPRPVARGRAACPPCGPPGTGPPARGRAWRLGLPACVGPPAVARCPPAAIRRRAARGRPPTFHQNARPIHDNPYRVWFFFPRAWCRLRRSSQ